VPTNQQRREAAKRKLQRQLERREKQQRARRQRLIIIGVVAAVLVVSGAVWLIVGTRGEPAASGADDTASTAPTSPTEPATPCTYPSAEPAVKDATPPTNLSPLNTGTVEVEMTLNGATVPITLDRALAPCGVNSFVSLASQSFYNETTCHRLTVSPALNILQCGDPSGQGNGGPGYSFATEVSDTATYPVGTVALANAAGTNGSQFFIVYGETTLPPEYTIIGNVTGAGMAVIEQIAAGGTANGGQSGPPATTATIEQITVPADALEGTGTYETATETAVPTDGVVPTDVLPSEPTVSESVPASPSETTGGAG
jgi:peptidyl-prolyl cis-trans isomerase B (cyclophilin B)